jgi:2-hydroxymethylglutarate dehydrogenase
MKIGMIGLGAMGLPITRRLLDAQFELYAFDLVPQAIEKAKSSGAIICEEAAKVASYAKIILFSLPNADIVQSVLNEILNSNNINAEIIADLSSIAPESTKKFADMAKKHGISYMDCPVSGGVSGAQAGTLTIMAGGSWQNMEKLMPVLKAFGKNIRHIGDTGTGTAIKMINNFILGCNMATVAEALVLGKKLNLDLDIMHDVLSTSSGRSFIIENKIPNFIKKRDFTGGFTVNLEHKDLMLAIESARKLSMPTPMGSMAVQIFEFARAKGYGQEDITSLVKIWEELMNITVE